MWLTSLLWPIEISRGHMLFQVKQAKQYMSNIADSFLCEVRGRWALALGRRGFIRSTLYLYRRCVRDISTPSPRRRRRIKLSFVQWHNKRSSNKRYIFLFYRLPNITICLDLKVASRICTLPQKTLKYWLYFHSSLMHLRSISLLICFVIWHLREDLELFRWRNCGNSFLLYRYFWFTHVQVGKLTFGRYNIFRKSWNHTRIRMSSYILNLLYGWRLCINVCIFALYSKMFLFTYINK